MPANSPSQPKADQSRFQDCYRGRQSVFHHLAYMRMAKVLVTLQALKDNRVSLSNKDIFDYGFGAGTFFRYCPRDASLYGVEQDAQNVNSVQKMLHEHGYTRLNLSTIDIASWEQHPLLNRRYDFILCSHVMEHLPDPDGFLTRISQCLKPEGIFMGIVPINERVLNPHHVGDVNRSKIEKWTTQPGIELCYYAEFDPLMYWFQPLFAHDSGLRHKIAQAVSLMFGITATMLGNHVWHVLGQVAASILPLKPTQAAFLVRMKNP